MGFSFTNFGAVGFIIRWNVALKAEKIVYSNLTDPLALLLNHS